MKIFRANLSTIAIVLALIVNAYAAWPIIKRWFSKRDKIEQSTRFDRMKSIHHFHLTQYNYEEIIPIEREGKLMVLLVVPASIEGYVDMDEMKHQETDSTIIIELPGIRLSPVLTMIDSAKVYDFKRWGLTLVARPYTEAVQDIKDGIAQAKTNVSEKAIVNGIIERSENDLKDWIESTLRGWTKKEIIFAQIQKLENEK